MTIKSPADLVAYLNARLGIVENRRTIATKLGSTTEQYDDGQAVAYREALRAAEALQATQK